MANIGALTFWKVNGNFRGPQHRLKLIVRSGQWGVAYHRTGRRAKPFQLIVTVDLASNVAVENSLIAQEALIGTTVSVVNSKGNSISNCVVEDMFDLGARRVLNHDGGLLPAGTALYVLSTRYILRYALGV